MERIPRAGSSRKVKALLKTPADGGSAQHLPPRPDGRGRLHLCERGPGRLRACQGLGKAFPGQGLRRPARALRHLAIANLACDRKPPSKRAPDWWPGRIAAKPLRAFWRRPAWRSCCCAGAGPGGGHPRRPALADPQHVRRGRPDRHALGPHGRRWPDHRLGRRAERCPACTASPFRCCPGYREHSATAISPITTTIVSTTAHSA